MKLPPGPCSPGVPGISAVGLGGRGWLFVVIVRVGGSCGRSRARWFGVAGDPFVAVCFRPRAVGRAGLDVWGAGCDDSPVIHGVLPVFIYVPVGLVALGVIGYFNERRRRGPEGVRRFLIWYVIVWPFMAAGLCALAFPRLHWLYIVQIGIAGVGYGVQILDFRRSRARAAARLQGVRPSPGSRS